MAGRVDPLRRNAVAHRHQFCLPIPLRKSRLEASIGRLPGTAAASGRIASDWHIHLNAYPQPDRGWRGNIWGLLAPLGARMGERLRFGALCPRYGLPLGAYAFRVLR